MVDEAQELYVDPDEQIYRRISTAEHMFTGDEFAVVCLNIDADVPWMLVPLADFDKHFKRMKK